MRYTTFGRGTGLRVSEYALGTVNFGTRWGGGAEPDEARKVFDRFADAGGTLIDTADCYQFGQAEELLGDFLAADRDHFVLATKFGYGSTAQPRISGTGNSRKNIVRSVEASLARLSTDYIDLYWAHFPDTVTPLEEILGALDDLVRAGKILHAGLSNFPAWQVSRAVTIAELRHLAPVTAIQTEYSLADRTAERELLPMAQSLGLGVGLWSPLGGGLLTGKYRTGAEGRLTDWKGRVIRTESTSQRTAVVDAVCAIAAETGLPASQVSVAWVRERARHAATAFVPVIGPRTVAQLDDYLAALDVDLTGEQLARLDEASAVALGSPHEVSAAARGRLLGGDPERVRVPGITAP
ncbi:aldo/keto reductase [Streptomyces sp. NPDC057621]|uniref:aldo/keto reductase n=1 Tax=unclassified Streptomyces TaxID=2593676 RepID=UPI0036BA983E